MVLSRQIKDLIKKAGSKIIIRKYDIYSNKDEVYGESKTKRYLAPIELSALVYFDPAEEMLSENGMDKDLTELLVKIAYQELAVKNLISPKGGTTITQDDLFVINGVKYKINRVKPSVHYNKHLIYVFGAIRA